MIQTINKSLLEADTKYIAHQCNCVTSRSLGIAKAIFDKYSWANTYKNRKLLDNSCRKGLSNYSNKIKNESKQGTIDILGNGQDKRFVINMYIQRKPGKPDGYSKLDQRKDRLVWLGVCLDQVSKIKNIESIAFPEGMGCRLAGGFWSEVLPILEEFADKIYKEQGAITYLYKYSQTDIIIREELRKINKIDPDLFDLNLLKGVIGNAL